jgi:hypothetical protein
MWHDGFFYRAANIGFEYQGAHAHWLVFNQKMPLPLFYMQKWV